MKKTIIFFFVALIFSFISCSRLLYIKKEENRTLGYFSDFKNSKNDIGYLRAFTHPFDTNQIKTFEVNLYVGKKLFLKTDEEGAGYYVTVKKKKYNYFLVTINPENYSLIEKELWIKNTDLGIVIQNYDNLHIPMYKLPYPNSKILTYIKTSEIGQIIDFKSGLYSDCYVKLRLISDLEGWVNLEYLCPDMRTTCP